MNNLIELLKRARRDLLDTGTDNTELMVDINKALREYDENFNLTIVESGE